MRGRGGTTIKEPAIIEMCEFHEPVSGQGVFGEQVGRIGIPEDLPEVDAAAADGLLDPEGVCVEMPQLPESLTGTYAD